MQLYQPILDQTTKFFAEVNLEPRRVFHGRGHMYPGLEHINLDWYPPVLLVSGYSEIEQVEALAEEILKGDVSNSNGDSSIKIQPGSNC